MTCPWMKMSHMSSMEHIVLVPFHFELVNFFMCLLGWRIYRLLCFRRSGVFPFFQNRYTRWTYNIWVWKRIENRNLSIWMNEKILTQAARRTRNFFFVLTNFNTFFKTSKGWSFLSKYPFGAFFRLFEFFRTPDFTPLYICCFLFQIPREAPLQLQSTFL